MASSAALVFFAALAASVAHLGQPLRAWRIFLGLRRSWLSREAVILGAAAPFVALSAALPWLPSLSFPLPAFAASGLELVTHHSSLVTSGAIAATAAGVFCSAMIYIDTRRRFWRPANTFARMGGTVVVAALAFVAPPFAALALAAKLLAERLLLRASPVSARLHAGPLRRLALTRQGFAAAAILTWVLSFLVPLTTPALILAAALFAVGELLERTLYFRAVDAPKMPGVPA